MYDMDRALRFIKVEDVVINVDEIAAIYPVNANQTVRMVMKNGHVVEFPQEGGVRLLEWFDEYCKTRQGQRFTYPI